MNVVCACPFCQSTGEVVIEGFGVARCFECARVFDPALEHGFIRAPKVENDDSLDRVMVAIQVEGRIIEAARLHKQMLPQLLPRRSRVA